MAKNILSPSEAPVFFRKLALLYSSGIPVIEGLKQLRDFSESKDIRVALNKVRIRVQKGDFFTDAMTAEGMLTGFQSGVMRIGEESGNLDRVLSAFADEAEREIAFRRGIVSRAIYPLLLLTASFLFPPVYYFIVYRDFGAYFLRAFLPLIIALSTVFVLFRLHKFFRRKAAFCVDYDGLLLRIPLTGSIINTVDWVRFCRSFVLGYGAGMDIKEVIKLSGNTMKNCFLKNEVTGIVAYIDKGNSLAASISKVRQAPGIMFEMLSTGEVSGSLDSTLRKAADILEDQTNYKIKLLTEIFFVLSFLLVAGFIGYQYIETFMSYFHHISDF